MVFNLKSLFEKLSLSNSSGNKVKNSGTTDQSSAAEAINIINSGNGNTIIGKLNIGQPVPDLSKQDIDYLLHRLPSKTCPTLVSAINGDNRATLLGQKLMSILMNEGFTNIIGVNSVFVPLINGIEIIKDNHKQIVLIGAV